jgi:hypothetical protein
MKKTAIASALGLALLGTGSAHAANVGVLPGYGPIASDSGNFTFLANDGSSFGAANNLVINWDGTAFNANSDYTGPGGASNMSVASTTYILGHNWIAHDIQVFAPGSYSFDTALGGGLNDYEAGMLNMTVGSNQLGMHMLFDWNSNSNIDVAMVWERNAVFGSGLTYLNHASTCITPGTNCLWDQGPYGSAGQPAGNTQWMLTSVDANGDGVPGIPMVSSGPYGGGPFAGFNISFNVQPVPLPSAAILLGSGFLGLLGIARKRKRKPA